MGICSKAEKIFQQVWGEGWTGSTFDFSQNRAGFMTLGWAVRLQLLLTTCFSPHLGIWLLELYPLGRQHLVCV